MQVYPYGCANSVDQTHSDPSEKEDAQSSFNYSFKLGYNYLLLFELYFTFVLLLNKLST